ncbi:hypothetical protein RMSM_06242 [Rhodopirellula maiorica SM1]|uniref:DUF3616 domain-containing protein n=1 Tax=Rhodopirellula maiorica SM1 TaxID=1265738 RepID=M5RN90_9BACT|nr:DUF3616 domain-containing protein [Rhodopirellula maiorica]EMI16847.1 hypothetical protein RMSM_06242 [Rhodopirellula maiorica SM1]
MAKQTKSEHERNDLRIPSEHNEVSAMTACYNRRVLDAFGFDLAFWIVSDEAQAHHSVALLGRQQCAESQSTDDDADAWHVIPVKAKLSKHSTDEETDDPECVARVGGWIYIFGSHFGSKSGPLDPQRHFIARFNESLVEIRNEKLKTQMDVCRVPFALHRAINDAITQRDLKLIAAGSQSLKNYIRATIADADGDQPKWRDRLHHSDRPINIEGVAFLPNGRVLIGLRYPVTAEGHPILVEVDGIDRLFEKKGLRKFGRVKATRVFVLQNVGKAEQPAGIRAMIQRGRTVYAITGDLDSDPDESQILADHPKGFDSPNRYHVFDIPDGPDYGVEPIQVETRFTFEQRDNVEGVAVTDDGSVWFVHDDEDIHLTTMSQ